MERLLHQGNSAQWEWAASLNWGIFYIDSNLAVHLGNELGAAFLNTEYAPNRTVPLWECMSAQSEEYQIFTKMMTSQQELRSSLLLWQTANRLHHVILDSYSVRRDDGTFAGMYVVAKDLGNLMLAEQQLQRNDRLLTVGKVAAGVAHEIRNPLTTIKGFVQVLDNQHAHRGSDLPSAEETYLKMILSEIERVEFIVTDLLMLANPHQVKKTNCDFHRLFAELRAAVDNRIEKQKMNVRVVFMVEDLPVIEADAEMLTHALMNVIANALDAMTENHAKPSDADTLTVHAYGSQSALHIDIADTGPGIPYYQTDKIFDAFFTTKDAGVGLGLPICQRIINDHGGDIRLSSKGFGTTFHIVLPVPSA